MTCVRMYVYNIELYVDLNAFFHKTDSVDNVFTGASVFYFPRNSFDQVTNFYYTLDLIGEDDSFFFFYIRE